MFASGFLPRKINSSSFGDVWGDLETNTIDFFWNYFSPSFSPRKITSFRFGDVWGDFETKTIEFSGTILPQVFLVAKSTTLASDMIGKILKMEIIEFFLNYF